MTARSKARSNTGIVGSSHTHKVINCWTALMTSSWRSPLEQISSLFIYSQHGPHRKHRLSLLWIHVCRFVAWQQTSYISVLLLGPDSIENTVSLLLLLAETCLQKRCLVTRWPNPLQYIRLDFKFTEQLPSNGQLDRTVESSPWQRCREVFTATLCSNLHCAVRLGTARHGEDTALTIHVTLYCYWTSTPQSWLGWDSVGTHDKILFLPTSFIFS
jgi:hypothetical protein